LAAGVRSAATTERQLLYGVSKYRVDVRIEPQPNSERVALVGQILNSTDPGKSVGAVPVRLCQGRRVLAESMTSPFGEFDVECDLGKGLQLRVSLPQEELCLPVMEPTIRPVPETTDSKHFRNKLKKDKERTRKKV
ncbi:MAG: hypothetical protein WB460_13185, partial [Candidatus Acidiferrales bacterium]